MRPRHIFAFSTALVLTLTICGDAFAQARDVIGVNTGLFFEDSERTGEEQTSVQVEDETFEYISDGFLSGGIYYLGAWSDQLRIGGGIQYYGKYIGEIVPEEELDEDEDPELFEFGTLLEVRALLEYLFPAGVFDLGLGAVVGIPVLFPDGDFKDEIDRLQDQQASVWSLPRIGFLIGPRVTGIYHYSEYLSFRLDIGVIWERIWLFNTSEEVQGIPFSKTWTSKILRTEFALGLEVKI